MPRPSLSVPAPSAFPGCSSIPPTVCSLTPRASYNPSLEKQPPGPRLSSSGHLSPEISGCDLEPEAPAVSLLLVPMVGCEG